MVREKTDKIASDIQVSMIKTLERNVKEMLSLRDKQKWTIEKSKVNNAGGLRGIRFIDPEDKEFKETIRNDRKNWKHQWLPPCFARHARKARMERPVARRMIQKTVLILKQREQLTSHVTFSHFSH